MNNSNPQPEELIDDNDTFVIGLGARLRFRPTVYAVVEASPRVSGFDPGVTLVSFGIEKRSAATCFS